MIKLRLVVLLIFLSLLTYSQQQSTVPYRAKTMAVNIYGFTRYFDWPNLDIDADFKIGLMGADEQLIKEFNGLARFRRVANKNIAIVNLDAYPDMRRLPQMKYCM